MEDGDGAQAAASAGSKFCSSRGDYDDSPRGQYGDENKYQTVPEGWKHATQSLLHFCSLGAKQILDTLNLQGDPAYKFKGEEDIIWAPFGTESNEGCAVTRFYVIMQNVKDGIRKNACLWCDILPGFISNADYAKVVDNLIQDCRGMNKEESEPIKLVMAASVDTKAELVKSALAVAAFAHNDRKHVKNNSAVHWEPGTYFEGDRPD